MTIADIQVHGYRKGHQLLSSSIMLSKDDQAVVDRLSDVAGPLRPNEQFAPYLSAYPLPSGTYYVVARTWQDLSVPRAGCVRTKSVLIGIQDWASRPPIISILQLLDPTNLPIEAEAFSLELEEPVNGQFPPVSNFGASELLEALFLEDPKPVVMFDAPLPELIALRLLAALWPNIRRRFALSTFALSPRKIGGRDFDIVFAPSNAKAKFSDWPGRRVDGRSSQINRHRWTGTIMRRVFEDPVPKLLSDREIDLLGESDADSSTALRVALLWDELLEKLNRMPTAALGLLDIANSGMVSNAEAVKSLEPRLVTATREAGNSLSPEDAWDFVGAIARKMQGYDMPDGRGAVEQLASSLAERAPEGAVNLLRQPDPKGAIDDLILSIAVGLGNGVAPRVEQALAQAPIDILARLVSQGGALTSRIAADDELIEKMGVVLTEVDRDLADRSGMMLLPFLVEDRQWVAAVPIFDRLDTQQIVAELLWLREANRFQAKRLCAKLIDRAHEVGGIPAVREVLVSSASSIWRDALLARTVEPVVTDVQWLLDEKRLSETTSTSLLLSVLRRANEKHLITLLSDHMLGERIIEHLPHDAAEMLVTVVLQDALPMNTHIHAIRSVISMVDAVQKFEIARSVLGRCLRTPMNSDQTSILPILLGILGDRLDGGWATRTGVERGIDAEVASRNLIAFDMAPTAARTRIVRAVDEIARTLHGRRNIDLTELGCDAFARLLFDAENISHKSFIDASGWLTTSLLRARSEPVSLMIAALFPKTYPKSEKFEEISDFLMYVPFLEWDTRKIARNELVSAFMSSSWRAGDLALTACRCGDVTKILERVARSHGGKEYLARIESDLGRLNAESQRLVKRVIAELRY